MSKKSNKIIKNFIDSERVVRRQIRGFVKAMCEAARGGEVEAILLGKGMAACVARDWGNEHRRRDNILKRAIDHKYRKETSAFGKRGQSGRRIIASTIRLGRSLEFHATKGERDYRIMA